ncbi:MAG: hypothetical protein HN909_03485 [Phycisphaerales bacterium]|nr:hypothetical protein [Phycisphaerales bacterium]MBT7170815.1 hypothetical protein [Phycisphaerales bacterium]
MSDTQNKFETVIREDGRYAPEAYGFLHDALALAVERVHDAQSDDHHVSGQELSAALRDLAKTRYGLMAKTVLTHWGVRKSIDFGNMVYLLIDHDLMGKTDGDSIDDFRDQFDVEIDLDTLDDIRFSD